MTICPQCGEENPAKFRLCGFCGAALQPALPPQEVRKTVSIVFSDLKGSTSLGESLDSESLREVMTRYFDEMRAVLEHHGGTIEKFIGDAVMAVFGLPKLHEDDALRAVRAAADMQRALARLNVELERVWGVTLTNRTGVNTGEVVAGDPTTGQRLVTGDAVNVAARLEQAAPAMEVLLGELTYRLVRDAVEVEVVEPLELKGKAERVPAYRLVAVAERGEGWARRSDTQIIGRDVELSQLVAAFDEAVHERDCRLVSVLADAGVGKSRLHDELLRSLRGRARVLRGRCLSYGAGITFWPLAEALKEAASIRDDDTAETACGKLAALAGEGGTAVAERIASALGLVPVQYPIEEIFWATRRLFETMAADVPLVVLFDDVHWAAPTLLDLVDHLVNEVRGAPLLLLCPARPDLSEKRAGWAEGPRRSLIELAPLTDAHTEQVIERLLGGVGIASEARSRITAAAEGNPLFVEQLLSMLVERGTLRQHDGHWEGTSDLADLDVPPTIQALLAARLDQLDPEERTVVEPASVIGLVFPESAVEELAPESVRARVPAHLVALERKHLVRPEPAVAGDDERYRFDHVMIREAAYGALLKRARATFHERFVDWADRVNRERGREAEFEEILGYHLEQAHRYLGELGPLDHHGHELGSRAATRLASAGRRAFARADMAAATNLLGRAIALLPERDHRRLELLPDLGEALVETGEFDQADAFLLEALEGAAQARSERLAAHAKLGRLLVQRYAGEEIGWDQQVFTETSAAIAALEPCDDHVGLAKAYRLLCLVHGTACRFADFLAADEQYLRHAELAGDRRLQTHAVVATAIAATYGPTPVDEAIARCEELMGRAQASRRSAGIVTAHYALLHAMQGDFERGRALCAEARAILEDAGAWMMAYARSLDAGAIELMAGEPAAAERELLRDYQTLVEMRETYFLPSIAALLAEALWAQRRLDEADRYCQVAQDLTALDDVWTQAAWRSVRAKVLSQRESHTDALSLAKEAVELLAQTDAPVWRGDASRDYAEVLNAAGRLAEAHEQQLQSLALYASKGDMASAERARAALRHVAEPTAAV